MWCSRPQTDKHLPQIPFTDHFLDGDILHCLLCVLSFYAVSEFENQSQQIKGIIVFVSDRQI
jgi:hypothetical protein